MRRRRFAILGAVMATALALPLVIGTVPAMATVGGGPWDMKVVWWPANACGSPCGNPPATFFSFRIEASFSTGDTAAYRTCWTQGSTNDGGGGYFTPNSTNDNGGWHWRPLASPRFGTSIYDDGNTSTSAYWPSVGNSPSAFWFVHDGDQCSDATKRLPIRSTGATSVVPTQVTSATAPTSTGWANVLPDGQSPTPPFTCAATRTLSDTTSMNADFTATTSAPPPSGTTDTYSWNFGDSITSTIGPKISHRYPALSSMPDGGWTATLSITRGTTTQVCTPVRVDFLHPSDTTAGTSGGDNDDSDCPTGFGWINPLAIAKILKCLFIPNDLDGLSEIWGDFTTKAPFSWAYEVLAFIPGIFDGFRDGVDTWLTASHENAIGPGMHCQNHLFNAGPGQSVSGQINRPFDGSPGAAGGIDLGDSDCLNLAAEAGPLHTFITTFRFVLLVLMYAGVAISSYNTVTWAVN